MNSSKKPDKDGSMGSLKDFLALVLTIVVALALIYIVTKGGTRRIAQAARKIAIKRRVAFGIYAVLGVIAWLSRNQISKIIPHINIGVNQTLKVYTDFGQLCLECIQTCWKSTFCFFRNPYLKYLKEYCAEETSLSEAYGFIKAFVLGESGSGYQVPQSNSWNMDSDPEEEEPNTKGLGFGQSDEKNSWGNAMRSTVSTVLSLFWQSKENEYKESSENLDLSNPTQDGGSSLVTKIQDLFAEGLGLNNIMRVNLLTQFLEQIHPLVKKDLMIDSELVVVGDSGRIPVYLNVFNSVLAIKQNVEHHYPRIDKQYIREFGLKDFGKSENPSYRIQAELLLESHILDIEAAKSLIHYMKSAGTVEGGSLLVDAEIALRKGVNVVSLVADCLYSTVETTANTVARVRDKTAHVARYLSDGLVKLIEDRQALEQQKRKAEEALERAIRQEKQRWDKLSPISKAGQLVCKVGGAILRRGFGVIENMMDSGAHLLRIGGIY